jgi:hypothetical protein
MKPRNGEIQLLVTDEPVEFERKKNKLVHIQELDEIIDPFRGICMIFINLIKKIERCQHVTDWSWKH